MNKLYLQFMEGGWVMYPVFAMGFICVGAAARFAWRGEHQLVAFIQWMLRSLLTVGAFGFVVGMMRVLHYAQKPDDARQMARIVMEGTTEASNNVAAALMFSFFAGVLVAVGQRRFPLPNPSAVAR